MLSYGLYFIFQLILTLLIAGIIGWQAKIGVFSHAPRAGWDWITWIFTIWNVYAILSTALALGLSVSGIVFVLLAGSSFALGWNYVSLSAFMWDVRHIGFLPALRSAWRSFSAQFRRK